MSATRQKAELIATRELSPSVRELSFALEHGPLAFRAGQWVNVFARAGERELKRAYSIASAPLAAQLSLAVTRVPDGVLSPRLHELAPGAELVLDGPFGEFVRPLDTQREAALFVATGTGLAPFRSMILDAIAHDALGPTVVLLGVRSEDDILWRDELEHLAQVHPQLRLEITLSRPSPAWTGRRGYVQASLHELVERHGRPVVYACGLSRMTSEVRRVLKEELGYDRRRVRTERYD